MIVQNLEQEVEEALDAIFSLPKSNRFRCHEVARLIRDNLKGRGYGNLVVRDGIVQYDGTFLMRLMEKQLGLDEKWSDEEKIDTSPSPALSRNYGFTKRIAHSWCEMDDLVIDHQNIVKIPPNAVIEQITIVEPKQQLLTTAIYKPIGREFRAFGATWIYIPFYVTKLRI